MHACWEVFKGVLSSDSANLTDCLQPILFSQATHHFTVLKDKQEGNGLNTLSQALQDVRVLQNSAETKK